MEHGKASQGLAELLEQYAEATAARVAALVNHQEPEQQRYYTTAEAAAYLRCAPGRIYNLSSEGRLKGRREGGRLIFTRADLDGIVEMAP